MKLYIESIMPSAASKDKKVIIKIDLKGSIDNNNTPEFEYIISTLINGGVKKIVLDIDELQYLDSTGIAALITATKKIRKEKGEIIITRYTAQMLTIFKPINLEKFIQFFPTAEEGINYFQTLEL